MIMTVVPRDPRGDTDNTPDGALEILRLEKCAYAVNRLLGLSILHSHPRLVNKTYIHFLRHMKKLLLAEYDWEALFIEAKSIEWFTSGKGGSSSTFPGEC
jgi:hypothetical protein